jgi:Ni/Co efflux regulator RcnB
MKPIKTLLAVAVAAAGLVAAADVQAQAKHGWRGGGDRHWGGHRHWHGHRGHFWGPRLGFYIGAPFVLGTYWGSPFWYDEPRVIYREVIREPEYIEGEREPAPASEAPRGEGAPTQGPLYMNYCASAKAYFPKVTSCPEGWKFITPVQ